MANDNWIQAHVILAGDLTREERAIKEISISTGKVSGLKLRNLEIYIYGGSIQARSAVANKIRAFFSSSLHGEVLYKKLSSRQSFFGSKTSSIDTVIMSKSFGPRFLEGNVALAFVGAPSTEVEDLSKGDLKKTKTTTVDGSVTTSTTVTEGHGGDLTALNLGPLVPKIASTSGYKHWAGKMIEKEKGRRILWGAITLVATNKVGFAETEALMGLNVDNEGIKYGIGGAARGPNCALGGKIRVNLFGGFDLITLAVNPTTGTQASVDVGYTADRGFGVSAKAALGPGIGIKVGVLNFFNKSKSTSVGKGKFEDYGGKHK